MLGIDTSKNTLQCALRDPHTKDLLWEMQVRNTPQGVAQLLKRTPQAVAWVIEPTGRYSTAVVAQAQQAGRRVLLAAPRKAKAFLASLQSRAKTDRLDSQGLALYGLSQPLAPYPVKEAAIEALDQLLLARRGLSKACSKLQQQLQELPAARESLQRALEGLKTELKSLDRQIAAAVAHHPKLAVAQSLQEVPGIGPVTAAAVAARLASKQFTHPDQFVAYVGLDIDVRQSGQSKGQRGLTHQGDAELRRLLYCCAQSSLRAKDSPFKAQYERERAKGLPTTAALCAVARKLAKVCWSLHKHNTPYDPKRVYAAPARSSVPPEEPAATKSSSPLDNGP